MAVTAAILGPLRDPTGASPLTTTAKATPQQAKQHHNSQSNTTTGKATPQQPKQHHNRQSNTTTAKATPQQPKQHHNS